MWGKYKEYITYMLYILNIYPTFIDILYNILYKYII